MEIRLVSQRRSNSIGRHRFLVKIINRWACLLERTSIWFRQINIREPPRLMIQRLPVFEICQHHVFTGETTFRFDKNRSPKTFPGYVRTWILISWLASSDCFDAFIIRVESEHSGKYMRELNCRRTFAGIHLRTQCGQKWLETHTQQPQTSNTFWTPTQLHPLHEQCVLWPFVLFYGVTNKLLPERIVIFIVGIHITLVIFWCSIGMMRFRKKIYKFKFIQLWFTRFTYYNSVQSILLEIIYLLVRCWTAFVDDYLKLDISFAARNNGFYLFAIWYEDHNVFMIMNTF